ncbi:hypothetical protein [Halobacterium hubeiense]|uniref:hypothetical protein n=1 Tax=Halobacterium hubeiense TaxID=1407499 RepID=UPI003C725018
MWSSTRDGVALDDRQPVGFDPATTVSVSRLDDEYDGYVLIEVDPRLLNWLLKGSEHAHWSDAKIGSHLGIAKQPDIYERQLYNCLGSFHA